MSSVQYADSPWATVPLNLAVTRLSRLFLPNSLSKNLKMLSSFVEYRFSKLGSGVHCRQTKKPDATSCAQGLYVRPAYLDTYGAPDDIQPIGGSEF